MQFLVDTAGQLLSLNDHLSVVKSGFINSETIDIVTMNDQCTYDIEFNFIEARIEPTPPVGKTSYDILKEDGDELLTQAGANLYLESAP